MALIVEQVRAAFASGNRSSLLPQYSRAAQLIARTAVPVVADNVLEYWLHRKDAAIDHVSLSNILPPWPTFAVEMRRPPDGSLPPRMAALASYPRRWSVFFNCWTAETIEGGELGGPIDKATCAWVYLAMVFAENDRELPEPLVVGAVIRVSATGKLTGYKCFPLTAEAKQQYGSDVREVHEAAVHIMLCPALLAIDFCHYRGITLVDHAPPDRLNRARARKNKPPLVTYKTITIDVGKPRVVSPRDEAYGSRGGGLAVGIVKGSDARYKPEEGHFYMGRPHDEEIVVFRPAHLKGDPKHGKVVKTYNVKAPEEPDDPGTQGPEQQVGEPDGDT